MNLMRFGGTWLDADKILVALVGLSTRTGEEVLRVYMDTGGPTFMVGLSGKDREGMEDYLAATCDDWTPLKPMPPLQEE